MSHSFKAPRLTVAIPLFNAKRWFDAIVQNIKHIPRDVTIVISDETCIDDTLQLIAANFARYPHIHVRQGSVGTGWREHCNALIKESTTEYFSLLPQDDLIAPDYYKKLLLALDENPKAGMAFGTIIAEIPNQRSEALAAPPFVLGQREPWVEAIDLDRNWNLGIPFRGVIRQKMLRSIPATAGDRFADQIWVFGMALSAPLIYVSDAIYYKRYHANNTHTKWSPLSGEERRLALIAEIKAVLKEDKVAATQAIHLLDNPSQLLIRSDYI